MASSSTSVDPLRRYEAIEKAYCEGRWATVLEAGTLLLRELSEAEDQDEAAGLRYRMHLLMAHTLLHGYGDRDAAEDLYEVVRKSDAEPSLRQIAEDGLDQCHQPLSSTFVAEDGEEDDIQARPSLFLPETEEEDLVTSTGPGQPAMAAPTVVLHKEQPRPPAPVSAPAAESTAAPVQLAVARPPHDTAAAEEPADSGLAADPFRRTQSASAGETIHIGLPVMPWLTTTEGAPETELEAETGPLPRAGGEPKLAPPPPASLIPDVVEEPELLEVHQATPALAEEVELEITSSPPPLTTPRIRPVAQPEPEPVEDDMADLRCFLLEVKLAG